MMMEQIRQHARREEGATAVEYGIMVALIAVVVIVAVALIGTQLLGAFTSVNEELCKADDGTWVAATDDADADCT